ncbi:MULTISPECIES: hypothetical protein [Paraclostridium]|uniref:hypothetical protein n=1 Tax=Paraclostridium TaxID=1849822 RepID=UPI0006B30985|nr:MULTISPECIES: hypothetical protein [Paraclostridium]MCU9816456.1 hypothetical protein [Paraclostridium sp. AKS73]OXX83489.1 hypothetical protein AVM15_10585 [Paraclostridium benzoelyticum]
MGIDKFLVDEEKVELPKKNYKSKVDDKLKTKFEEEEVKPNSINLLEMEEDKKSSKKVSMSIYFEEDDLKLLKAISKFKNTTVNKTVMSILEGPLETTKSNLPNDFNIDKLAKDYDKTSRNKKARR